MGLTLTTGKPFRIFVFGRQASMGGPVLREDGPNLDVQLKYYSCFSAEKRCIYSVLCFLSRQDNAGLTGSAYSLADSILPTI